MLARSISALETRHNVGTDVIIVLYLPLIWDRHQILTRKLRLNSISTPCLKQRTMTAGVSNCGRHCISGAIRERNLTGATSSEKNRCQRYLVRRIRGTAETVDERPQWQFGPQPVAIQGVKERRALPFKKYYLQNLRAKVDTVVT